MSLFVSKEDFIRKMEKIENSRETSSKTVNSMEFSDESVKKLGLIILSRRFSIRQNSAFRSLRSDCTKLKHRRMSWVVSKGRAFIFLS